MFFAPKKPGKFESHLICHCFYPPSFFQLYVFVSSQIVSLITVGTWSHGSFFWGRGRGGDHLFLPRWTRDKSEVGPGGGRHQLLFSLDVTILITATPTFLLFLRHRHLENICHLQWNQLPGIISVFIWAWFRHKRFCRNCLEQLHLGCVRGKMLYPVKLWLAFEDCLTKEWWPSTHFIWPTVLCISPKAWKAHFFALLI